MQQEQLLSVRGSSAPAWLVALVKQTLDPARRL
jgi:hypothetical protein